MMQIRVNKRAISLEILLTTVESLAEGDESNGTCSASSVANHVKARSDPSGCSPLSIFGCPASSLKLAETRFI